MGRLNMLSKDEDGDTPTVEKITAESPEPHIAVLRQLGSQFSGHTGVPLSSLGISTDNAESADAKSMAREDIINDVEKQQVIYDDALLRVVENSVMIRDGLAEPPAGILDLSFKWRRADRPTLVAIADAGAKQVAAIPALAETEVGMEMIGMEPDQIDRARGELRRLAGSDALAQLLNRTQATDEAVSEGAGDADELKKKFDALGVAIRAGVDPKDAARRLGLEGIAFTGATPVALRLPTDEASKLEDR